MIQILLCSFGYILLLNKPDQNLVTWDNSSCSFCFYFDNLAIIQLDSSLFRVLSDGMTSFGGGAFTLKMLRSHDGHSALAFSWERSHGCGLKGPQFLPFSPLHWLPGYLTRVRVSKDRHAGSYFLRSGSGNWLIISAVNYWSNSYRFKG